MSRTRPNRRALLLGLAVALLFTAVPGPATAGAAIPLAAVTAMTPARAAADRERLWSDNCMGYERTTVPRHCAYGVTTSHTVLALVGDSHAAQLFPAVERVAKAQGWRLEVFVKVSCAFSSMTMWNATLGRIYTECATWNANVVRRIAALKPAMTLVVNSRFTRAAYPADTTSARRAAAIAREVRKLYGRVTLITDSPLAGSNIPPCLAAHLRDIRPCATSRAAATYGSLGAIEKLVVAATGDGLINLTPDICPSWPCPAVRNRAIVFRDLSHLTATFARSLAPALSARLLPLMP